MTPRARFYMAVVATRSLLLAIFCIGLPGTFTSASYRGLMEAFQPLAPESVIQLWGVAWAITSVTAYYAVLTGREGEARAGLMMSIVASACWATGFSIALFSGHATGPTGVIVWWALVLKDGSMLRQPLRNPFEPLVQRVLKQNKRQAAVDRQLRG